MAEAFLPVNWLWFTIGLFVGANFGFLILALLRAGHEDHNQRGFDHWRRHYIRDENGEGRYEDDRGQL